jgi:hypothetical protein
MKRCFVPDPGSPHTHPDDYAALGLDFERDNAAVPKRRGPAKNPEQDAQLAEQICRRLEQNQFVEERCIHVVSHDCEVTLEGIVENRFARERAEQLAREVEGVETIENRIHIQKPEDAVGGPVLTVQDPEQGGNDPSAQRS